MTTIVADRKQMSADTLVSGGSGCYHTTKIFKLRGAVVGAAGSVQHTTKFFEWFSNGCPPTTEVLDQSESGFEAIALTKKGIYFYQDLCDPDRVHENFFAIGTGGMAALAAMHLGKGTDEAVKVAKKCDAQTGGEVTTLVLMVNASEDDDGRKPTVHAQGDTED